jgi:hypothetical protein
MRVDEERATAVRGDREPTGGASTLPSGRTTWA